MKHVLTLIFFTVFTFSATKTAELKREAEKATTLSQEVVDKEITNYIKLYDQLKSELLKNNLVDAKKLLHLLQETFLKLSKEARAELLLITINDEVTSAIGREPKTFKFFHRATALINKIENKTTNPLINKQESGLSYENLSTKDKDAAQEQYYQQAGGLYRPSVHPIDILTDSINKNNIPLMLHILNEHPEFVSKNNVYNHLPLQIAASIGNKKVVDYIITHFPDTLNMPQKDLGRAPLHVGSSTNHTEVVQLLLAKGANIEAKDNEGRTPLFDALEEPDTFTLLLANNAKVDVVDKSRWTIITSILAHTLPDLKEKMLKILFESPQVKNNDEVRNFLANQKDPDDGLQPLCYVAEREAKKHLNPEDRSVNWPALAEILIANGADCAAPKYKEFLVPIIKKFEGEAKRVAERRTQLQQQTPLMNDLSNIVEQFLIGEPPQKTESTSATAK